MRLEMVKAGSHPLQYRNDSKQMTTALNGSKVQNVITQNVQDETINNTDKVETVVSNLNEMMEPLQTNLKFVFHEELHEYYVTVVNPITDEVIKEIPPKKMLDMYASMAEFMGLLVDEKI
ncbi:flagellar protein FlaG [Virgibacillus dakarensis]|uniref:Flagellar biosynthesis protein FlaG n=1 Tax=Lentibacillus populi TaxID=1827502 RepID=A0A9W5U0T7_9BACI|nr:MULTISPECIES: flagellar protein FlaG [Bacillaceae]MBT2216104.1 flagellar protein FlaG [Virgibacillus dakarensis]MTW86380.1 flagellar protein FlaG [Virgibacillus dakarensis]GGB55350.1 hypothetical protein GCM10011409_36220 [Lentibacillus populi]